MPEVVQCVETKAAAPVATRRVSRVRKETRGEDVLWENPLNWRGKWMFGLRAHWPARATSRTKTNYLHEDLYIASLTAESSNHKGRQFFATPQDDQDGKAGGEAEKALELLLTNPTIVQL